MDINATQIDEKFVKEFLVFIKKKIHFLKLDLKELEDLHIMFTKMGERFSNDSSAKNIE